MNFLQALVFNGGKGTLERICIGHCAKALEMIKSRKLMSTSRPYLTRFVHIVLLLIFLFVMTLNKSAEAFPYFCSLRRPYPQFLIPYLCPPEQTQAHISYYMFCKFFKLPREGKWVFDIWLPEHFYCSHFFFVSFSLRIQSAFCRRRYQARFGERCGF